MTTFLLIRHGDNDAIGKVLAGSLPGWHLNPRGKQQAESLAARLQHIPIRAIYTSPLERTVETAAPLARQLGLQPQTIRDLEDVRFGEWQGLTIPELEGRDDFRRYNTHRSLVRPPSGELMLETQTRMVRQIDCLRARHPNDVVAVFSHGDPLRATLAFYLGIPLDFILRFEIHPASVSVLQVSDQGARVISLNQTEGIPV